MVKWFVQLTAPIIQQHEAEDVVVHLFELDSLPDLGRPCQINTQLELEIELLGGARLSRAICLELPAGHASEAVHGGVRDDDVSRISVVS